MHLFVGSFAIIGMVPGETGLLRIYLSGEERDGKRASIFHEQKH